jgi:NAD(P)-dependent dehydrogenase (short-subunit alcohol dehydrogenase family)
MPDNKQNKYTNPFMATFTGIRDLLRKKPQSLTLKEDERLEGKKVLVTGASSGLGLATSVRLAKRGAHVIMVCRSGIPEKGEEVKIRSGSGNVDMVQVDFADIDSVKQMVLEVKERFGRVDIYVCNAAVVTKGARKTKYELDEMFQVNYLSKFITANLLIDEGIIASNGTGIPRIIFVASESHRNPVDFDWENFGKFQSYGVNKTVGFYGYYKLLLVTFANELSRRLNPGNEVNYSVLSLCPGPVNSNIAREAPALFQPLLKLVFSIFFRSPEKASDPVIFQACSREQEGKRIDYLFLMNRKEMDPKATDPGNGKRLWELTRKLAEKIS